MNWMRDARCWSISYARLAAGLCLPAAVCCSALPSAVFSVARVEAVRARRAREGGGGARLQTEMRRGAAPPHGAIRDVAHAAAASGGSCSAFALDCRNGIVASPQIALARRCSFAC